jgi:hypothetical protein
MIDYPTWGRDETWEEFADAQLDHEPTEDQIARKFEVKQASEGEP